MNSESFVAANVIALVTHTAVYIYFTFLIIDIDPTS